MQMAESPPEISTDLSTTLSGTLDSSRTFSSNSRSHVDVSRVELEQRQLVHTVQLLKLELSQKQLLLDTVKNEQASQLEELQEQLADATHEKKLLSLRLQSLTHGYEQELMKAREELQKQKVRVGREEVVVKSRNSIISDVRQELEEALSSAPVLSETKQEQTDITRLGIGEEYVQLRFCELTRPLQKQSEDRQRRSNLLSQQVKEGAKEVKLAQEALDLERARATKLEGKCSDVTSELRSVKTHILEGNYKMDNFDSVKRERDSLKLEAEGHQNVLTELERRRNVLTLELEKVTKELSSVKQAEVLLRHDKDYLGRQVSDASHKCAGLEEKLDLVTGELAVAKQDKEKLYQQLVSGKEDLRLEYSHRLNSELDTLRDRTAMEMEQLKTQTKEMYDRESKLLTSARDAAIMEQDKVKATQKELREKYENLLKDYHSLQGMCDKRLAEVQGELQVVRFEKERTGLVQQETIKDRKQLQLEQEKLQKKVELLTQEVWGVRRESEMKAGELKTDLQEAHLRLESYEKVEKELDDIVMQSAQMEHSCDAERVLFTYGFGTSVPTNSKRRLQQSVQLARRVLQLEKTNTGLRDQLRKGEEHACVLQEELQCCKELLNCTQQPRGYLLERVTSLQAELQLSKEKMSKVEEMVEAVTREKAVVVETKNKMAADLERLLNHREELQYMKGLLLDNTRVSPGTAPGVGTGPTKRTNSARSPRHVSSHNQRPPPTGCTHHHKSHHSPAHQPHPTVFTKTTSASS